MTPTGKSQNRRKLEATTVFRLRAIVFDFHKNKFFKRGGESEGGDKGGEGEKEGKIIRIQGKKINL